MNEDPRDDWTLLGLTAIAVLAALGAALAWRASPARDTVVEELRRIEQQTADRRSNARQRHEYGNGRKNDSAF